MIYRMMTVMMCRMMIAMMGRVVMVMINSIKNFDTVYHTLHSERRCGRFFSASFTSFYKESCWCFQGEVSIRFIFNRRRYENERLA